MLAQHLVFHRAMGGCTVGSGWVQMVERAAVAASMGVSSCMDPTPGVT